MHGASSTREKGDATILNDFIRHINSDEKLRIPTETLCGGVTHFLSTLTGPDLRRLILALLDSQSLWQGSNAMKVRQAIRLSVSARVSRTQQYYKQAYFGTSRLNRGLRRWLGEIITCIEGHADTPSYKNVVIGMIQGKGDQRDLDWGKEGVKLEEEAVIILAGMQTPSQPSLCGTPAISSFPQSPLPQSSFAQPLALLPSLSLDMEAICIVIPNIDVVRLQALDLKDLFGTIQQDLRTSLNGKSSPESVAAVAQALACLINALDSGDSSSRSFIWQAIPELCKTMQLNPRQPESDGEKTNWDSAKLSLFAFLLPATAILDIILKSIPPNLPSTSVSLDARARIAIYILRAMYTFSEVVDGVEGGLEGYQKVLLGCLDVLAAKGGVEGVSRLFDDIKGEDEGSDGEDTFLLVVAEELVNLIEPRIARDVLLRADRHLYDASHRASFEAAHALIFAFIEAASHVSNSTDYTFLEEMLPFYAWELVNQAQEGNISPDQLRSAYPTVTKALTSYFPNPAEYSIEMLCDNARNGHTHLEQTVRLIQIDIAYLYPRDQLQGHLDRLALDMLETETGSNDRLEVCAAAFKMVMEGLPDESRGVGMEWWLEWRDRFGGREVKKGMLAGVQARL